MDIDQVIDMIMDDCCNCSEDGMTEDCTDCYHYWTVHHLQKLYDMDIPEEEEC